MTDRPTEKPIHEMSPREAAEGQAWMIDAMLQDGTVKSVARFLKVPKSRVRECRDLADRLKAQGLTSPRGRVVNAMGTISYPVERR